MGTLGAAVHLWVSWGTDWLSRSASVEEVPRADPRNTRTSPQQQVLNCFPSFFNSLSHSFFFLFHELFLPLLNLLLSYSPSLQSCRYKSSQKEVNWSKLKKPVYLSKRGSRFSDWSATWAGYLISKVSWTLFSSQTFHLYSDINVSFKSEILGAGFVIFQVRHELASKVFTCCSFIIKHDYKVTIYLLPHILLYMLLGCTPAEQQEVRTCLYNCTHARRWGKVAIITHTIHLP